MIEKKNQIQPREQMSKLNRLKLTIKGKYLTADKIQAQKPE